MSWSELELDALAETFNIGIGLAGDSLSRMVGDKVLLSSPTLRFVALHTLGQEAAFSSEPNSMCTVFQHFDGVFSADALLMFPERSSLELIRLMLGNSTPLDEIADFEREALTEVGNVVLNSCMAALADTFSYQLHSSLPECVIGDWMDALRKRSEHEYQVLLLTVDFSVEHHQLDGYLLFAMGGESMQQLKQGVQAYIARLSKPS
jgi:chemotaxis protein CheC